MERYPCQVIVSNFEEDEVLNQSFSHPELLGRSDSFLRQYSMFEVDRKDGEAGPSCLIMTYGLDKERLATVIFTVMALCLTIGLIAGVLTKRTDLGFLFGGGALSFLTSAQVTVFWMFG